MALSMRAYLLFVVWLLVIPVVILAISAVALFQANRTDPDALLHFTICIALSMAGLLLANVCVWSISTLQVNISPTGPALHLRSWLSTTSHQKPWVFGVLLTLGSAGTMMYAVYSGDIVLGVNVGVSLYPFGMLFTTIAYMARAKFMADMALKPFVHLPSYCQRIYDQKVNEKELERLMRNERIRDAEAEDVVVVKINRNSFDDAQVAEAIDITALQPKVETLDGSLARLAELKRKGFITEEEFLIAKQILFKQQKERKEESSDANKPQTLLPTVTWGKYKRTTTKESTDEPNEKRVPSKRLSKGTPTSQPTKDPKPDTNSLSAAPSQPAQPVKQVTDDELVSVIKQQTVLSNNRARLVRANTNADNNAESTEALKAQIAQLTKQQEELANKLFNALQDRETAEEDEEYESDDSVEWLHPVRVHGGSATSNFSGVSFSLLDPDQVDEILFGDDMLDNEFFKIHDLETDPILSGMGSIGDMDIDGIVSSKSKSSKSASKSKKSGKKQAKKKPAEGRPTSGVRDSSLQRMSLEFKVNYVTRFLQTYYRNERFHLQCFPVCQEYHDYARMKELNAKHSDGRRCCAGNISSVFFCGAAIAEQPLIALGRIISLESTKHDAFAVVGRVVNEPILLSMAQQGQFSMADIVPVDTKGPVHTLALEFAPATKSWMYRGVLDKRRPKKSKAGTTVNRVFAYEVLIFAPSVRGRFSTSSTGIMESPHTLIHRTHSEPFGITTTRKLARKKKADGASPTGTSKD